MSRKSRSAINGNELLAIKLALENQIDLCEDYLSDPDTDFLARPKLQETLRYSRSALAKIESVKDEFFPD